MRKLVISASILTVIGGIWALIIMTSPDSAAGIQGVGNGISHLFASRVFLFFFPLFLILLMLSFFMSQLKGEEEDKKFKKIFTENRIALEGLEAVTKNLIELRQMGYTSQFFNHLPIIYQDFYEMLRRMIRKTAVLPDLPTMDSRPETQDLWVLCRSFLRAIEKNPSIFDELRRNFKKNETLSQEMTLFRNRFDRFLKALQSYDRDHFIVQFIQEGSLGRVYDILTTAFNEAHPANQNECGTDSMEKIIKVEEKITIQEEAIQPPTPKNPVEKAVKKTTVEKILPLKAENMEMMDNEEFLKNLKSESVGNNPFLNNLSPGEPTLFDKKKK